jgi:aspartyl-tRNA(Asn)/glutamyl-tRNA(Gln) amidotransferase subunit B
VREAVLTEIERQVREVEAGRRIEAWTLEWDENGDKEHPSGMLRKMRSKETEADYRYFREPDLLPIQLDDAWLAGILSELPELPLERRARFAEEYGLPEYDADILTAERSLSDYYEETVRFFNDGSSAKSAEAPKRVSNWLMNDVLRMINESGIPAGELRLTPAYLAEIIKLVDAGGINNSTGKALLEKVQTTGRAPAEIVQAEGLAKVSDQDAIRAVAAEVLAESPDQAANYKAGKTTLIGWFVGQVMKRSRGKADPQLARTILEELLSK